MRAVQFSQFGGPEVLEVVDTEDPQPGPGQIRVAVRAAGINPIDWKVRSGMMGGDLPQTTGREAAGVVDAVGEGVADVAVGDEVFGFAGSGGAAAERVLMEEYAPIPGGLDFAHAAGLPVAIETATRTLDLLAVSDGQTLLINGAAGGVGSAAVQLAVARGARVIGTASEGNHEYLCSLGADPTTYGEGLVERVRAITGDGVDRALDAAGGGALPALVELTGDSKLVVTIADYQGAEANRVQMSGGMGTARAVHALHDIADLIAAGRFSLLVSKTFTLDDIADAHRVSETGHVRGKLVVLVS